MRRHPLSVCCAEHWISREPGCADCERAAEAAEFWASLDAAIGRPLGPAHRAQIADILEHPLGLLGAHDVPQTGRGPRIKRVSTEAILGLAVIFEASTGHRATVRVRNTAEPLGPRSNEFEAFLLLIRRKLDPSARLISERQFLRRARVLLKEAELKSPATAAKSAMVASCHLASHDEPEGQWQETLKGKMRRAAAR